MYVLHNNSEINDENMTLFYQERCTHNSRYMQKGNGMDRSYVAFISHSIIVRERKKRTPLLSLDERDDAALQWNLFLGIPHAKFSYEINNNWFRSQSNQYSQNYIWYTWMEKKRVKMEWVKVKLRCSIIFYNYISSFLFLFQYLSI